MDESVRLRNVMSGREQKQSISAALRAQFLKIRLDRYCPTLGRRLRAKQGLGKAWFRISRSRKASLCARVAEWQTRQA